MAETINEEAALKIKSESEQQRGGAKPHGQVEEKQPQSGASTDSIGDHGHTDVERASTPVEIQDGQATRSDKPYSAFSSKEKWVIIVLISLASVFS